MPATHETYACPASVCTDLSKVSASQWNALLSPDDEDAPLLSWEFLQGLESSGCVGGSSGWFPYHLLIRENGVLVAAAPAYLKTDSSGEWVGDGEWAILSLALRARYYPKLVLAVPWNPVTGSRLLVLPTLPSEERRRLRRLLLVSAKRVCRRAGLSSAHILFVRGSHLPPGTNATDADAHPHPDDNALSLCQTEDFWPRRQTQYHFHNRGYAVFDDFLADLRSHRRHSIRRERRLLAESGVTVTTHAGLHTDQDAPPDNTTPGEKPTRGFTRAELDLMFDLYVDTSIRYTGEKPFLHRSFFHLCADRLGTRIELTLARNREGEILAGAWNLRGNRTRWGRYWGTRSTLPFLHFEVCYYHPIERCIAEGLSIFEPGHGGDHKLLRGFEPTYTYSSHFFSDPKLHQLVGRYLFHDAKWAEAIADTEKRRCPLRQTPHPDDPNHADRPESPDRPETTDPK